MHPGLQRLFLETLMKDEFKSFQYFITTHSNHFLDITLDFDNISIYTVNKHYNESDVRDSFSIELAANSDIRILDLIGARSSSVFLSNCTIWVEGITDRLYLKNFLSIYQDSLIDNAEINSAFKEDYNYSFVEYSGGNIVHWSFTDEDAVDKIRSSKISNKIIVIADKDNTDENVNSAKARRLNELSRALGDNFIVVNGKEIENILNPNIIISTVQQLQKRGKEIEFDKDDILFEKYQDKGLGEFVENNFKNLSRKFKADSGTILPKLDFCKTAVNNMKSMDDLSDAGKEIARRIYEFIYRSNVLKK
jgi:predicted ATP-dependent endonuclease of OLD family